MSLLLLIALAKIETNGVVIHAPPSWLKELKVRQVVTQVENFLEWNIRKVQAYFYSSEEAFHQAHGLPGARAATRRSDQTIHLGPKVTEKNFSEAFGHELVHIILLQKYKKAIPEWLEEGLANYVSHKNPPDYSFVAKSAPIDIRSLTHPFSPGADTRFHYEASTAVMWMIAAKCPLKDLLALSVGKNLELYLKNFCKIEDVNASFWKWVSEKRGR